MISSRAFAVLLLELLLLCQSPIISIHAFSSSVIRTTTRQPTATASTSTTTSTALYMSSPSDDFMKSLQSRMAQVQDEDSTLPIVVLDAMLPKQVLKIEVENDIFQSLVKDCIERERPRFGMIGTATLANNGQTWPLQNGVEVEIVNPPSVVDAAPTQQGTSGSPENGSSTGKALRVKLVAGRRFRIHQGELKTNPAGWTEAKVEFLDSKQEDQAESDALSLQRAKQLAKQLADSGLVERWIELAKTKEHFKGQIDQLLEDLGPMPSPTEQPTSELAFWIGALINPLPGMGVAMELRPQLLMAKSAEERIGTVYSGIEASIGHMDGTKPLF